MTKHRKALPVIAGGLLFIVIAFVAGRWALNYTLAADDVPLGWTMEWSETDFSRHAVPLDEIMSGGVPKDAIRSVDDPKFIPVRENDFIKPTEPVISISHQGEARAYPLRVLMPHEIVNDEIKGVPIAVTFCPLCNSAIVFDRRVDGKVLEFGTTGKLRNSDLVMYDRQTESWWQQFEGRAIVGEMTGKTLTALASRLESLDKFQDRFPNGKLLVGPHGRRYSNPYEGYDSAARPFLYRGTLPKDIHPMLRVVAVDDEAWSLSFLKKHKRVEKGDLVITWEPGQNSALDTRDVSKGKDVGNVVVQRKTKDGMKDAVHDIVFAFVFHAFKPEGKIHHVN